MSCRTPLGWVFGFLSMSLFLSLFESSNPNRCLYPVFCPALQRPASIAHRDGPNSPALYGRFVTAPVEVGSRSKRPRWPTRPRPGAASAAAARARRGVGSASGARQTWFSPSMPASATTASQKALPSRVLAKLELQPEYPQDHLAEPSPARSPSLEALAEARVAGIDPPRGGVHDVLGVALDHGHHCLEAVEGARLLGARQQARQIAAQHLANRRAGVGAKKPPGRAGRSSRGPAAPRRPRSTGPEAPPGADAARAPRRTGSSGWSRGSRSSAERAPDPPRAGDARRRGSGPRTPGAAACPSAPAGRRTGRAPCAPRSPPRPRPRPPPRLPPASGRGRPSGPGSERPSATRRSSWSESSRIVRSPIRVHSARSTSSGWGSSPAGRRRE